MDDRAGRQRPAAAVDKGRTDDWLADDIRRWRDRRPEPEYRQRQGSLEHAAGGVGPGRAPGSSSSVCFRGCRCLWASFVFIAQHVRQSPDPRVSGGVAKEEGVEEPLANRLAAGRPLWCTNEKRWRGARGKPDFRVRFSTTTFRSWSCEWVGPRANLNLPAYWGSLPLINTTLNLVATRELDWQERKAESFLLSPIYCGSESTGYQLLPDDYRSRQHDPGPGRRGFRCRRRSQYGPSYVARRDRAA